MVDQTLYLLVHTQQITLQQWHTLLVQMPDEINLRNAVLLVGTWLVARWLTKLTLVVRQPQRS